MHNVLLVNLFAPSMSLHQAQEDATEMYYLVDSLGDAKVVEMIHQRGYPAKAAYIGRGKAIEVGEKVKELHIDIVILNGITKPRQLYELWQTLSLIKRDIIIWDRVDLILHIFAKHANTAEAKLQIELASMRHMGPRIYGMGNVLSQQAGGIGTRGIGETNVELMKRHWKDAIRHTKNKLKKLESQRTMQINTRRKTGIPTVSIIGYTNAGKTTLFNQLTRKGKFADNLLFATLDSTISTLYLPNTHKEIFVSDTIGFIKNLPPSLIEAFTSTLLESIHADLLIHVLDGSASSVYNQYRVVEQVLSDLKLEEKMEIIVVNKVELMEESAKIEIQDRLHNAQPLFLSAQTGEGIPELISTIEFILYQ